jgi:hypothetical protein
MRTKFSAKVIVFFYLSKIAANRRKEIEFLFLHLQPET